MADVLGGAHGSSRCRSGRESLLDALRGYVAGVDRTPEDFVNVVIPEMVQPSLLRYLVGRSSSSG